MNILHAGQLAKSKENFTVVQLGPEYIDEVVALQKRVHQNMLNKNWFVCDSGDDIDQMLREGGAMFGVLNSQEQIIASRYVSTPGNTEYNLANQLNLEIDLDKVMILESTVVDPNYRGNRLQSIMLQIAHDFAEDSGYRHLLSTVSPENIFSLYNVMTLGLKIRALKKLYQTQTGDGVWRFVLHKDLQQAPTWLKKLEIGLGELDLQTLLIDKGFFGDSVSRQSKSIVYAR